MSACLPAVIFHKGARSPVTGRSTGSWPRVGCHEPCCSLLTSTIHMCFGLFTLCSLSTSSLWLGQELLSCQGCACWPLTVYRCLRQQLPPEAPPLSRKALALTGLCFNPQPTFGSPSGEVQILLLIWGSLPLLPRDLAWPPYYNIILTSVTYKNPVPIQLSPCPFNYWCQSITEHRQLTVVLCM